MSLYPCSFLVTPRAMYHTSLHMKATLKCHTSLAYLRSVEALTVHCTVMQQKHLRYGIKVQDKNHLDLACKENQMLTMASSVGNGTRYSNLSHGKRIRVFLFIKFGLTKLCYCLKRRHFHSLKVGLTRT